MPGLTGLRGFGALWVVAYHAQQFGSDVPLAKLGYLGVDLFFLLSGFVLSHAHPDELRRWTGYRRYLQARFARIFPLHWITLLLVLMVVLVDGRMAAAMPQRFEWPELVASVFLVQNWGWGADAPWNGPAWSLSTEWMVSIALPVFLAAAARTRRPALACLCCFSSLAALAVYLRVAGIPTFNVSGSAGIVRTVCEFAAGCFLYRVHAAGWASGTVRGVLVTAAAVALVATGLLARAPEALAVFGFAALVLAAAQPASPAARLFSMQPIVFVGEISYSVYLLHMIVLQVLRSDPDGLWAQGGARRFLVFCAYLAFILVASAFTYRWIEVPARDLLRPARRVMSALPQLPKHGAVPNEGR